ncbi:ATP-dependent DNA ligase [Streptomyces longwoodensis]|uniref:ATP-dependent DNA ligase n=1 Tax=Streptomyces longwoodensis TaxID=68231 RepID=UPI003407D8B9
MTGSFPEIRVAALAQLLVDAGLDGELVVWERAGSRSSGSRSALPGAAAARWRGPCMWPAHYVVFDLVHADGADLTSWLYERRRAALEALFVDRRLEAPRTLCQLTTDPAVAWGWLEWTAAGSEGLGCKRLDGPYAGGTCCWAG